MTDWAGGYQAGVDYTFGYYSELNPLWLRMAFASSGIVAPEVRTACELGFGQGMSLNLHAAASTVEWYGTDFNPAQASFAQELATASGAPGQILDEAFAEFAARSDLPSFDFIALHGVWSWVSDENRATIVDFLRRKLRPGGVAYVAYNALPGWAPLLPLQHLLARHAELLDTAGAGATQRVDNALRFVERLVATNPRYLHAHPGFATRVRADMQRNRHYLAHEYFNGNFSPVHFSTLAESLAPAKLTFACFAHYLDGVDALHMTEQQRVFLEGIADPVMRQTVRDFVVNQQFRRDFWVKGLRRLTLLEQLEALRRQRVVLVRPRDGIELKVEGRLGEMMLSNAIYDPLLDVLSDHQPTTIGQLEQAVAGRGMSLPLVTQAVMMLIGAGKLAPAHDDETCSRVQARSDRLNDFILQSARGNVSILHMASPVVGGGIRVQRYDQLFLLGLRQGRKEPAELAQFAWQLLASQGEKVMKEGTPLETVDESLNELNAQAHSFRSKVLPMLAALRVTDRLQAGTAAPVS